MKMELRSKAIDKIYKRRDRIDMPDYQREEVWPISKKQLLIDSILQGWHIPKFYFQMVDKNSFECVDGQQRLSAIFEFFDNQLQLSEESKKKFNASTYNELPDDISDSFDDYEIEIEEIEDVNENELEELFQRLQLGTPLNTAEKLNAISGDMRDFCHEISSANFFENKIPLRNTRYAYFEIATRWLLLEARGIQPQLRFPQLEGFLKENRTFSKESETAKKTTRALDYLDQAFPEKCKVLRSRANVLSVCMLASRIISHGIDRNTSKKFGDFIQSFFDDLAIEVEKGAESSEKDFLKYQQSISSGSASGQSITTRLDILSKKLARFSPEFAPIIGVFPNVESETINDLNDLAEDTKERIFKINKKYSGQNGEDLIKMTTKVSEGLTLLNQPCKSSTSFGNFIDSLYFIFYEGTGSCKRLSSPPPDFVIDIKNIRTIIRHDIDHGKKTDTQKKNIKLADAFKKYSGKVSIGECSPEEILTTQIRLLIAAVKFLADL
ncbi:DUF262 domain-containing protein [Chloroflexota bacterium]|nr:DUF262 domain-containing protein [Chloroflexota bacterium]